MFMVWPGTKLTPLADANCDGAPASALNWPFDPVTRLWTLPVSAGSLKVTAWPALMVTRAFEKLCSPMPMVAAPAPPPVDPVVAVGAGAVVAVAVGGAGAGVSVGVEAAALPPQAASRAAQSSRTTSASLRIGMNPPTV